ncbi:MAG: Type-1 restriction enzyme EcoKI specificity protein [Planctomycetes bacterium]|nr:Type-1 restriction enzyme EcoKI specificity protein [Planctomycetota bacterium]
MRLPNGWRFVRMEDVCTLMTNGFVGVATPHYREFGVPYLMANNVQPNKLIDVHLVYVSSEFHQSNQKSSLRQGDILTVQTGFIGVSCVVPEKYVGSNAHALIISRVRPKEADSRFVCELLNAQYGRHQIWRIQTGGGRPHLNTGDLLSFPLPLPPLEEQKRIAEILGEWNEAVEKVGQLIEAKQKLKRGLMQQLLTGDRTAKSKAARQWEHARLSELFEPVTSEVGEHKTTVLSITATVGFVDQAAKFSRVIAGEQLTKYVLLKRGEFAYNKGNSNAYPQGCIYMLEEFEEGAVPHVYISFRAKDASAHPEFYKHFFAAGGLNRQLHRLINSGVRNDGLLNLDEEGYFAMTVPKPPMDVQRRIADVFSTLDLELARLKALHSALTNQKRGLMQKLLTGQVRVKVSNAPSEVAHV